MVDYGFGTIGSIGESGFNSVDWTAMNKGITPVFMLLPLPDEKASEEQGRIVYRETEVVHLHIAGDSFSVHSQPVDDYIKRRFPDQYQHWKATNERKINGTPLAMWPMASPGFVKEMEAISVFSIEDLASIADVHLNRFPDGRIWREKAQAWLDNAKDTAVVTKFAAENERLRQRLEALEKTVGGQAQDSTNISRPVFRPALADVAPTEPVPVKGMSKEMREETSRRMKETWAKRKAIKADPTA